MSSLTRPQNFWLHVPALLAVFKRAMEEAHVHTDAGLFFNQIITTGDSDLITNLENSVEISTVLHQTHCCHHI